VTSRQGFEVLADDVVSKGRCTGCGACYAGCPFELVLDYAEGGPKVVGECKKCGICLRSCPRYRFDTAELEEHVFGRRRSQDDVFGLYLSLYAAKAVSPEVASVGQDGGVATALLDNAFRAGLIDGAVVSSTNPARPWFPVPILLRSSEGLASAAGTRYCYSPGITVLRKATADQLRHIGFVGTPCQVTALRRMQKLSLKKAVGIDFILGLFCSESFSYEGLMLGKIQRQLGISLADVEKMNIKGRMQVMVKGGKVVEMPLKEVRPYAQPYCRYCDDFSAEFADISLGGIGLDGRTLTIVRTERGTKLLKSAMESRAIEVKPLDEFKTALDLLVRLSANKRAKAQKMA
jgi:coenzyme F420 hydrogenase subunit beta